jgi:hypothetical protein
MATYRLECLYISHRIVLTIEARSLSKYLKIRSVPQRKQHFTITKIIWLIVLGISRCLS